MTERTAGYPGVYVDAIGQPSPPDAGVPTSLTAFVGRARMGPLETPVMLNSWADYERMFGGLDADSSMSYQVAAYFGNGGGQALCVRLFDPIDPHSRPVERPSGQALLDAMETYRALIPLDQGVPAGTAPLVLAAASPGDWGDALTARVDTDVDPAEAQAQGVSDPAVLFNLTVDYASPDGAIRTERFTGVTLDTRYPARLLAHVLADQSELVIHHSDGAVISGATGRGAGGRASYPLSMVAYLGDQAARTGLYALEQAAAFNILCIPPDEIDGDTAPLIYQTAAEYCAMRNAMLILDPPTVWQDKWARGEIDRVWWSDLGFFGLEARRNAAIYFPRVLAPDPLRNGEVRPFPNSGYIAGVWARTDTQVGVWKAPAGLDAAITGIEGLSAVVTDAQNGVLNPLGINGLRVFSPGGPVIWGARTLASFDPQEDRRVHEGGAPSPDDPYRYIPVRRLTLYVLDWTLQNTKWAVFEPNGPVLWSGLKTQISTFLNDLWKQGALFGSSASQAFFVQCDATTTTLEDIEAGRVNVQIGFAPARPAEFVVVTLAQVAGQGA